MALLLTEGTAKYAETNLMLTYNYNILNQWKNFNPILHKRRRTYAKNIACEAENPQNYETAFPNLEAELEKESAAAED